MTRVRAEAERNTKNAAENSRVAVSCRDLQIFSHKVICKIFF